MSYTFVEGGVCAAKGFSAGAVHAGIRKNRTKNDLALIVSDKPCAAAAIYTQNKVKGAPILVTQAHLKDGHAKAFLCNSGNANTCNADGVDIANAMCGSAAAALRISSDDVIVASTGVIGQPLPLAPITSAMPALAASLSETGSADAAEAIMTTDTKRKEVAVRFPLGGKTCTIGGIAKGSGMIHPNMATMLCFVTTDAAISPALLQKALKCVADETFNMVSVDGDTSTNDMLSILANGEAGNAEIVSMDADYYHFAQGLMMVCRQIAKELAADGEGASKLLECTVTGAPDKETAKKVAKSVVCSSLFKAAMFGEDANWGRILCAIGYTDAEFEIDRVAVSLSSDAGSVHVCENGAGVPFSEEEAKAVLGEKEIRIEVDMGQGGESATAWGCDLTYDYVKINGDYRT
ncbi:bifunctional glutamate N-acetyltransferase/amino-acid acetyltransferase ArgJ [Anaerotruncus sp. DFI.9.16]|uniref:bifunctional glutamate N-acetyltransferase/amino-acid acetyltransferase ArgJ n=1 Tax=Anaerotruncus sp. DFI.9.16 TaxID=2965275 RepID=UPI00210B25A2|nr:bifunctional glutamate N-acetyltransferase/amino-acid acetyltransferase ArgJ [Anaerotruncus sp. DFI.9.16]MCQ4897271.1 bifunctional glutamate N-acetyltransferase/amino-acid acetyltransferase ArgJ [Anaerotruncus sp. DFI.9.16]